MMARYFFANYHRIQNLPLQPPQLPESPCSASSPLHLYCLPLPLYPPILGPPGSTFGVCAVQNPLQLSLRRATDFFFVFHRRNFYIFMMLKAFFPAAIFSVRMPSPASPLQSPRYRRLSNSFPITLRAIGIQFISD